MNSNEDIDDGINKIDNENYIIDDTSEDIINNEINKIDKENDINDDNDIETNKSCIDKPIIEVSPNGTYLVTYNPENHSIVGWNANDIEEGQLTKSDASFKIDDRIDQIRVSDDKKLAYTIYEDDKCYPSKND
jgi:hypothetical protein